MFILNTNNVIIYHKTQDIGINKKLFKIVSQSMITYSLLSIMQLGKY